MSDPSSSTGAPGPSERVPLFARPDLEAPMLWRRGETLSQADVLAAIDAQRAQLPAAAGDAPSPAGDQPWLNLCLGRQAFMTGFCAVLVNGGTNVLASDPASGTVARLRATLPGLRVLGDDGARTDVRTDVDVLLAATGVANTRIEGPAHAPDVPDVPAAHVAALPFTSGSTGDPVAHPKRFGATRLTALATEARLFPEWARYSVLATVPSQHMYGLETTLMLALCGRALVACEHPLLPADILATLAQLPRPRVLVTTPVHLRALLRMTEGWARHVAAGAARGMRALPAVDRVISATAPLAHELAAQVERRLGCEVHEIYGCTEAGSLATRRTIDGDTWTLLDGYTLAPDGDLALQAAAVSGAQLAAPVTLPDRIACIDATRFRLLGRRDDMVNIGGKRASLSRLNQLLLQVEGVLDGWIHLPLDAGDDASTRARLQGLVVTDGRDERTVLRALATQMDAVFLPRPLRRVARIPRNATGKVTRAALDALLRGAPGDAPAVDGSADDSAGDAAHVDEGA
jgi:acyl-CoA synthetase (AMP-forming)/AMP-acid ligase II